MQIEPIGIDNLYSAMYHKAAGTYLSRWLKWIKEEGEIWANKCPKCARFVLPPKIVCGYCKVKIEDKEENWVKLRDTGVIVQCFLISDREIDRVTKKVVGEPNPNVFIRLDGGDEFTLLGHLLEEGVDLSKIQLGKTRVQAVWTPKEERLGRIRDIRYFRIIE